MPFMTSLGVGEGKGLPIFLSSACLPAFQPNLAGNEIHRLIWHFDVWTLDGVTNCFSLRDLPEYI